MENILATMQRRKILFLISLPRTLEFEKDKDDVNECINELRELQVDVREHIKPEDLADANRYDIVIVVAHHDCDNDDLILAEGTMKMTDFVNSLPSDYSGVIDFASCYSAMAYGAIKNHCPKCKVQAALIEVELLQRIIMYPALVEHLNEDVDIDYHDAYEEVSRAFDEDAESYTVKQDVPKMTQLGQQMSSIYSPSEVKRDNPFQILVFFHYDADKNVVKIKAQRRQTDSIIRDDFEIPVEMKEGDRISLSLSFDSTDNDNIKISNDEFKKDIILKKEMLIEYFKVKVLKDFCGNGFLAEIEMAKDDICFVRCAFNIGVTDNVNIAPAEIVADIPLPPEKTETSLSVYSTVFSKKEVEGRYDIFEKRYLEDINVIINKKAGDDTKLYEARKYLFDNFKSLIEQVTSIIEEIEKTFDSKEASNNDLLVKINKTYKGLHKKVDKSETAFNTISSNGKKLFIDMPLQSFLPVEKDFLNLVLDLKYLNSQLYLLGKIKAIRGLVNQNGKEKKELIRNRAEEFWTLVKEDDIDKELFKYFTDRSSTKSIISNSSSGVSAPFFALLLAMSCLKYQSVKRSQADWKINVADYMDNLSVPTKKRINEVVGLLNKDETQQMIDGYLKQTTRISICAYYLRKISVSII